MFLQPAKSLFDGIPTELPDELIETLHTSPNLRIERIVSRGQSSPPDFWYDQNEHEWVLLLEGAAQLEFEDGLMDMRRGEFVKIAAHRRHRVSWTDPERTTVWLAIHYGDPPSCANPPASPSSAPIITTSTT